MVRAPPTVPVICPKWPGPVDLAGRPKEGGFSTLLALALKSKFARSVILKILWSEALTTFRRGPTRELRPRFPKVPAVGAANAFTLNQLLMLWPPGTALQSPTTLGNHCAFDESAKLLFVSMVGVNGLPDCETKSANSCHPPITASTALLLFKYRRPTPIGRSYEA